MFFGHGPFLDDSVGTVLKKKSACTFAGGGKEEIGKHRTIEKQAQGSNGQFCVNKDFLTITGRRDTSKLVSSLSLTFPSKCG